MDFTYDDEQQALRAVYQRLRNAGKPPKLAFVAIARKLLTILNAPNGFGIGARHITVSTVGLVPAIRKLTEENLQVRLAVSLHAPDDELRDTLVPVNNRWKVGEVLDEARRYATTTGRRVNLPGVLPTPGIDTRESRSRRPASADRVRCKAAVLRDRKLEQSRCHDRFDGRHSLYPRPGSFDKCRDDDLRATTSTSGRS